MAPVVNTSASMDERNDITITMTREQWLCLTSVAAEAVNKAFGRYREAKRSHGHYFMEVLNHVKRQLTKGKI